MPTISKSELINYILIPTRKFRMRRIPFGRYIVEKQVAIYNLFGPGKQSSKPIEYFWEELTDKDVSFMEIDLNETFEIKRS